MIMNKDQKLKFVKTHVGLMGQYKSVGVIKLSGVPDRLLQSAKNRLKDNTYIIVGRKSLLVKILESSSNTKKLADHIGATSAIIFSNEDPFSLHSKFASNSIKLAAKPHQVVPQDINISAGETTLQPGKSVTELKQAGIDTQIQKGKVVIAKDKVIKKGEVVSLGLSKALQTLGIKPFVVNLAPTAIYADNILYTQAALRINATSVMVDMSGAIKNAISLSIAGKILNAFTINKFIIEAYSGAMALGVECKIYDKGIVDKLLAIGAIQAKALEESKK